MGRLLRWIGMFVVAIIVLVVVVAIAILAISESRINKTYDVQPAAVAIPTDAAAIERGRHLASTVADCVGCHGENLSGQTVVDAQR